MIAKPNKPATGAATLAAEPPAGDPLRAYCPDLAEWPRIWSYEARDIPPGQRMVECFTPFLRDLLAQNLSRTTLRRHRDNVWVLGGEIIRRLQIDEPLRRRPIEKVLRDAIGDEAGPLLSHHETEAEQRAFDATCRKLHRFLTANSPIRAHARSASETTNR
jgi:hypothetical protein